MKASSILRAISRLRYVLEGSIKAQTKGLDVDFHISNGGIFTLDFELRYVVWTGEASASAQGMCKVTRAVHKRLCICIIEVQMRKRRYKTALEN